MTQASTIPGASFAQGRWEAMGFQPGTAYHTVLRMAAHNFSDRLGSALTLLGHSSHILPVHLVSGHMLVERVGLISAALPNGTFTEPEWLDEATASLVIRPYAIRFEGRLMTLIAHATQGTKRLDGAIHVTGFAEISPGEAGFAPGACTNVWLQPVPPRHAAENPAQTTVQKLVELLG